MARSNNALRREIERRIQVEEEKQKTKLPPADQALLVSCALDFIESLVPKFVAGHASGDVIVGGKNFGCGSSREHAPIAIKAAGVSAVIAESFARIFFRNSINIGLPILESPEAASAIKAGDDVSFDLAGGKITSGDKTFDAEPYPQELQQIVAAGGLLNYVKANRK